MNDLDKPDTLAARLGSQDLKKLTGLTDRQLVEWGRRGMLPSSREGDRGWREFTPWHVIALSMVAELKRALGIPLGRQRAVLDWLMGGKLTPTLVQDLELATLALFGASDVITPTFGPLEDIADVRRSLRPLRSKPTVEALPTLIRYPVSDESTEASVAADQIQQFLTKRKWASSRAAVFANHFVDIQSGSTTGVAALPAIAALAALADEFDDVAATRAAAHLRRAVLPVSQCLTVMRAGFPVVLITDLNTSDFLDLYHHGEMATSGLLPPISISLRVDPIVSRVLSHVGVSVAGMHVNPARASTQIRRDRTEVEILQLITRREFDRVVVESADKNYHMLTDASFDDGTAEDVIQLISNGKFRTLTVTERDGTVTRFIKPTSTTTPLGDAVKTPAFSQDP